MFKLKLRSLNTPRLLLVFNIFVLIVTLCGIGGLIYNAVDNLSNLKIGLCEFQNNQQANLILDSILLGQCNINHLNMVPDNSCYRSQKKYYLNTVSSLLQKQMYLRS